MDGNRQGRPEPGHESRDVNVWAVGKFGMALAGLCVFASALLFGLFHYFLGVEGGPLPPEQVNIDARKKPPAPYLQESPVLDLKAMRAAEDQLLNSYGWIDQAHGIARVPVAAAIDMLAQRGLPARSQAPPASGITVPTESSLGPKMQAPGGPLAGELR